MYGAHIVTSDAVALGDPEIVVTFTEPDAAEEVIATYPLTPDQDPVEALHTFGWTTGSPPVVVEPGYFVVDEVVPRDWLALLTYVTDAKDRAAIEARRQDTGWRTVIRDAVQSGQSPTAIGRAAGISRERVYQIRDGRR